FGPAIVCERRQVLPPDGGASAKELIPQACGAPDRLALGGAEPDGDGPLDRFRGTPYVVEMEVLPVVAELVVGPTANHDLDSFLGAGAALATVDAEGGDSSIRWPTPGPQISG